MGLLDLIKTHFIHVWNSQTIKIKRPKHSHSGPMGTGHYYNEWKCGKEKGIIQCVAEKWEKTQRQAVAVLALWREAELVRNRQIWGACATTWIHGDVWAWTVTVVMPGPIALSEPGTVLKCVACVATKGHQDVLDVGCCQAPCGCLRVLPLLGGTLIWVAVLPPQAIVTSWPCGRF